MAKLEKDGRMGDGLANLAKPQQNQKTKTRKSIQSHIFTLTSNPPSNYFQRRPRASCTLSLPWLG